MKKLLTLLSGICLILATCITYGKAQAAETFELFFGGYSIGGYAIGEEQKTMTCVLAEDNMAEMDCSTDLSAIYFGVAEQELNIVSPSAITVKKTSDNTTIACKTGITELYWYQASSTTKSSEGRKEAANQKVKAVGIWLNNPVQEGEYIITVPANSVKSGKKTNETFCITLHVTDEETANYARYKEGVLSWNKIDGAELYQPCINADNAEGVKYEPHKVTERQLTYGTASSDGGWGKESIFLEKDNRIIMDFVNGCEILVDGHTYIYQIIAYDAKGEMLALQEAKYTYHEPENKLSTPEPGAFSKNNGKIFYVRASAPAGERYYYSYLYLYYCEPGKTNFELIHRLGGMIGKEYELTSYMTKAGTYKVKIIVGDKNSFSEYSDFTKEYKVESNHTTENTTNNRPSGSTSSHTSNRHNYSSQNTAVSVKSQWETTKTSWKWLKPDGTYAANEWQLINDKWYYFGSDTAMKTGWQLLNGKWYYMDAKNGDMKTDWQSINGKWYYMNPKNGDMQVGWLYWNKKWFWLNKDGDMATGWKQVGDQWYYLTAYGDCLINTITPDGHHVNENGALIK